MCEEENILTLDKLNNFMAMTGLFKRFMNPLLARQKIF